MQQGAQQQEVGDVSGIGHEVYYFACVILTSFFKDRESLALLEKNIPLKFWPCVRMVSAIVVNLLDTIIN